MGILQYPSCIDNVTPICCFRCLRVKMAFVTPAERVAQFPDELHLRNGGQLWCIWCDRELNPRRKDGIMDHFKSKTHINNKRDRKNNATGRSPANATPEHDSNLRKLFEESDSDSGTSFEGFDSPSSTKKKESGGDLSPMSSLDLTDDARKSGRQRKRPARLSEDVAAVGGITDQAAFISTMAKKRKIESDESSNSSPPIRVRSMPIKKQLSYSARKSDSTPPPSPVKKGSLKMKIAKNPGKQPDGYGTAEKNVKVVAKPASGKGLKLKFVWKKKQTSKSHDMSNTSQNSEDLSHSEDDDKAQKPETTVVGNDFKGTAEKIVKTPEKKITPVKRTDPIPPKPAAKHSKPDVAKDPKKNLDAPAPKKTKKAPVAGDDRKRKVTAYMVWAKQMREKITRQYPGLEFADVSKKLGNMWKRMPEKAKQMIKVRDLAGGGARNASPATPPKKGGRMIETGPKKQQNAKQISSAPTPVYANPESTMNKELSRLPPPSTEPLDSAAYFSLLGDTFGNLSAKTKLGSQVVQGADTVLLDSLLCAMVPLMALLRQIPELSDCIDPSTLRNCFSNIAHIVPGL